MKKYLLLQIKRILKFIPFVLIITLCLLLGLSLFSSSMIGMFADSEENTPITIAITGDTDNSYIQMGKAAMETLDDTRFSIIFEEMSEEDAEDALLNGRIAAYAIFPEDFIEKALYGEINPVTFVTAAGQSNIATLFKNEITAIVSDMLINSEKGTYGINDAMRDNGLKKDAYDTMQIISTRYLTMTMSRSSVYNATETGIANNLNIIEYLVCGITVLLLFMMGLPYAVIHIKKDYALSRLMLSRGYSCLSQLICEYTAHFIAMFLLVVSIIGSLGIIGSTAGSLSVLVTGTNLFVFFIRIIPMLIMLSAFNIFAFELADNLVSGMLIHFFSCLSMCYVSGCMYPIHTFPVALQKISEFLPTGMAVNWLSDNFTGEFSILPLMGLLAYSAVFFAAALFVRHKKTANKQRG